MGEYKGKKFVSIESAYEEIQKDLGFKPEDTSLASRLPEEDVTNFCLWLKNELQDNISKVQISKRLKDTPALVTGQMSSSMRVMMQMMESQGQMPGNPQEMSRMSKDNTLELNAGHPIVVNLNQLRKTNKDMASLVAKQLLDNVMITSGIPYDLNQGTQRQFELINAYLEAVVDSEPATATRKEIPIMNDEPALKQAEKMRAESNKSQVVWEKTVEESDRK